MKNHAVLFLMFLFASCVLLDASGCFGQNFLPWPVDKVVGESAPDFVLKDLSGKDVQLSSFKGKPVVLNFWATWCPYCRKERPHLKSLYEEFKDRDLVILSVSVDSSEGKVAKFVQQNPAPYVVLTDTEGMAAVPYNIMSLPTTYLIDRNGKIKKKFMGAVEWTDSSVKDLIAQLIDQH